MFNDNQQKALEKELNSNRIKTRSKGNINLSYLEGFDVIETANRVFGYGNWSYTIVKLDQVSQETNSKQNIVVSYKAVVNITIHDIKHLNSIQREDVGFGSGIAKSIADAHELALKESVTDGLKRALRSFGNQFGLSLYDKSKNHQSNEQTKPESTQHDQQSSHGFDQFEYQSLYNLGLNIVEHEGFLIVQGDDIFSKKDSIKACGFRWDSKTKQWYKQLEKSVA